MIQCNSAAILADGICIKQASSVPQSQIHIVRFNQLMMSVCVWSPCGRFCQDGSALVNLVRDLGQWGLMLTDWRRLHILSSFGRCTAFGDWCHAWHQWCSSPVSSCQNWITALLHSPVYHTAILTDCSLVTSDAACLTFGVQQYDLITLLHAGP